ncbi:MAG: FeoA family protein [Thermodesulfobacteriota bacterium]|nr:FeoA family protein [Thermodesulfobacteriota bacterium]
MNSAIKHIKGFPLSLADNGEMVKVVSLWKGRGFRARLISLGIDIGDVIEVLQCRQHGTVLVAKGGARYAIGCGMAQKIEVIPIPRG